MLAVKNSRTRWAVAESGENRAGELDTAARGSFRLSVGFLSFGRGRIRYRLIDRCGGRISDLRDGNAG